jgi:hypothetical protein
LRKQLLGKQASRSRLDYSKESERWPHETAPTKSKLREMKGGSDSEDEKGRTAFTGKKKEAVKNRHGSEKPRVPLKRAATEVNSSKIGSLDSSTSNPKKRPSSYLDEVLFTRSEKRKKKEKIRQAQE